MAICLYYITWLVRLAFMSDNFSVKTCAECFADFAIILIVPLIDLNTIDAAIAKGFLVSVQMVQPVKAN